MNQWMRGYAATAVSAMEAQLPMFSARCTSPPSRTRTIRIPTREKTIPSPARTMGRRMGPSPSVGSLAVVTWTPSTMVARMVAT
jgi:hypothetical protein